MYESHLSPPSDRRDHDAPEVPMSSAPEPMNSPFWPNASAPEFAGSGTTPDSQKKDNEPTLDLDTTRPRKWWQRKGMVLAIIAGLIIIVGLAVGLSVGLTRRTSREGDGGDSKIDKGDTDDNRGQFQGEVHSQILSAVEFEGKLYLFARTADNRLAYKTHDGKTWASKWEDLGESTGDMISQPAAMAWQPEAQDAQIDVFVVTSSNNSIWNRHLQADSWSEWEDFGPNAGSQVVLCRPENYRLDLWVTSVRDSGIFHNAWLADQSVRHWDTTANEPDESLNATAASAPAVLCRESRIIHDVVWYDSSFSRVWHRQASGTDGWQDPVSFEGSFVGDPTLFSPDDDPERMDFFCVQKDYKMGHFSWDSTQGGYSSPKILEGEVRSVPSIVSLSKDNLDMFALGDNDTVHHIHYDGSEWANDWKDLGLDAQSAPLAVTFGGKLLVFVVDKDGKVVCGSLDGDADPQTWSGSLDTEGLGGNMSLKYYSRDA